MFNTLLVKSFAEIRDILCTSIGDTKDTFVLFQKLISSHILNQDQLSGHDE